MISCKQKVPTIKAATKVMIRKSDMCPKREVTLEAFLLADNARNWFYSCYSLFLGKDLQNKTRITFFRVFSLHLARKRTKDEREMR